MLVIFKIGKAKDLVIKDNLFYLNDQHFEMLGLRTASTTQNDAFMHELLDALDEYEEVGLNTVSIYLQGSSGGYSDPFGGWTNRIIPPGVFKDENVRRIHLTEVEEAAKRPGLSVHLHNTPWCQGPELGYPPRYDLGGSGTENDPGIRWFFEYARSYKKRTKRFQSWPENPFV